MALLGVNPATGEALDPPFAEAGPPGPPDQGRGVHRLARRWPGAGAPRRFPHRADPGVDAQRLVVFIMALAFFGKGVGALGWAVISDATPREIAGLSGGLFNLFGNLPSITTPIIIGYIIQMTGSFDDALLFIGANWFLAIMSYLVAVGEIQRLELRKPVERGGLQP